METKLVLLGVAAMLMIAVDGCPVGQEFLTAFMPNFKAKHPRVSLQLAITAYKTKATVKVEVKSIHFSTTVQVQKWSTKRITLPPSAEIQDSGPSGKTVQISSDTDISVVAFNNKKSTGDSSVVFPMADLDTDYMIYTPNTSPSTMDKLVAVINGKDANTVEIFPYRNMKIRGNQYWQQATKVAIKLAPYEVYQFRSTVTFTGTRLKAKRPVAVLAGHQCSRLGGFCTHVYEQLPPVQRLSTHFLVPVMRNSKDMVHVVAIEDNTKVNIATGKNMKTGNLIAGQMWDVRIKRKTPLVIDSDKKVMVMYYSSNRPYDPFFISILPSSDLSNEWSLDTQKSFRNTAIIVSEADGIKTIRFNEKKLRKQVKWRPFPTEHRFLWATVPLGFKEQHISVTSDSLIAVYIYGGKRANGYGTTGVCYKGSVSPPPPDPCESIKCREKEECQKGVCVHISKATCRAVGDPHYSTFDGKRFDFQGTCTYTMSTTMGNDPSLIPFTILTKNNHRGNKYVSFVRKVTITVYSQTIAISNRRGMVEVNGVNSYLPATLAGGKLRVVHRGRAAILTTEFGLEVKYDWNSKLYITVPSSYFRALGGLCGNYNGNRQDEFTDPRGKKVSTVLEFAQIWKVKDGDIFCNDDCKGKCPSCSATLQEMYRREKFCGLMTQTDGAFSSCHKTLEPDMYVENCVYDVCINKGIKRFFCDNVESYADACMAEGVKLTGGSWRDLANCPMDCPANSHYESCGTGCPASCGDQDQVCNELCVEGCQCDKGFILSGDKCVHKSSCGCIHEGLYYQSEEEFWLDNKCTRRCKCNPKTAKVECSETKCKKSQVCDLRSGVRNCYPISFATCQGSGDPHYRTFDGKRFDFQGTCTYYLSKLVKTADPSLVPFEVRVQNQNRGRNKAVSYTKTVEITIYGNTIVLSKESPDKVLLNNEYMNLPFEVEEGKLSVFRSGYFGVIKTDFGLTLKFNWDSIVKLTLPSSYSGEVGGLCGNWNGNQNDDIVTPDNSPAKTPAIFGKSWKVRDDPGCSSDCSGKKCPKCDSTLISRYRKKRLCGIITDRRGPFMSCHGKVDPRQYFDDCVYDMCMYRGLAPSLCSALSAYTAACQDALVHISVWRSDSFCPSSCKANSHYEVCATGCPQTCRDLFESPSCEGSPCAEGCVCDDGFMLSDGECVPLAECGCVHGGRYYKMGQVFFPEGLCKQRCVCQEGGEVQCKQGFSCGPNEKCQVKDGVQACFPDGTGTCSVFGAAHYHSFDSRFFNMIGDCVYKMAEVIQMDEEIFFSVSVHQESITGDITVTRSVEIQVYEYMISLFPGVSWEATVDDIKMNLPLSLNEEKVKAYQSGFNIIVETDFGLKVSYDSASGTLIEVPSTYKGTMGGLCGNYNGNAADDFLLPSRVQAPSVEKFAEAWVSIQEGVQCQTGCGSQCPVPDKQKKPDAEKACSILTSKEGPMSQCYTAIPPQQHFEECVQEVITEQKDGSILCLHIQKYVALCQAVGVNVREWRTETFCSIECPANSHYELCADTCSSTCASLSVSSKCPRCQEGCQCDDDYVFDGDSCSPLENCGCMVDGRYYKSGESVTRDDCTEECSCEAGKFSCQPTKCSLSELCEVRDGVMECYMQDPCENVECREKEECQGGLCVHISKATCKAVGDPHYSTFDGKRYNFQGTCTYTMATTVDNDPDLKPFTILAKNDHRGNKRVSFVRTVTVSVYSQTIVVSKKRGMVEVNGVASYLPLTLVGGKLHVVHSGRFAVLKTDFGLEVKYDWNMILYITAPSSYFRTLGGLCGNYNGNRKDDFIDPKGKTVSTVLAFAKSWKSKDRDLLCHDDCRGKCPDCSQKQQKRYRNDKSCGLMSKPDGPFASCHDTEDWNMYVDNCVYDICTNKGYKKFLCDNMEAYADACQAAGVQVGKNWRTLAGCPMNCPANSHYESCGTACPVSCGDLNPVCKELCVEGCQCDKGFILSGDKCVHKSSCGCIHEGLYYQSEEEFWLDNKCTRRCKCNPKTAKVECSEKKCKKSQVCDLRSGVRNCYPISFATCQGSGDPHYRTFDGKRFDFQGTCTYYLSKLVKTADPSLVPFEVRVQNQNRGRNKAVSYTKTVEITIYGNTIILSKESPDKVLLNNEYMNLPFEVEEGKLSVFRSGYFGVIKTDFGLTLKFNWDSIVKLTLPSSYSGEVGGLCGNWNGNQNDDIVTPDNSPAKTLAIFGKIWKVRDDPGCSSDCSGKKCPKCDSTLISRYRKKELCGTITDLGGPFKLCHGKIDPKQYFDDCVYDMCMYRGLAPSLCSALSAYTAACQDALVHIAVWRSDSFCPSSCKANSHYEVCATGCPQTCRDFFESPSCEGSPCAEGCVCDDGFMLSDGECVPLAECGCVHGGRYYKMGQVFFPEGLCKQRCVCKEGGEVQCKQGFSCGPNEKCQVKDGVQACFPNGTGTCSVFGAAHYHSFDSRFFYMIGDCVYKMAEVIQMDEEIFFSVSVHQQSIAGEITVTRSVEIQVYDYMISLFPGVSWEAMVDDIKMNLPLSLNDEKVKAYQSGFNIIVETDFGLKVSYDSASGTLIEVPSTYKGTMGGLCGNYNGNAADDFLLPSRVQAPSVEKFAEAWVSIQEGVQCQTGCGSQCPVPDKQKKPDAEKACSILTSKEGPMSQCYTAVPPQQHFEECVQEVITEQKDGSILCLHIQKYVALCQAVGVTVREWRTEKFCSIECPANSHYELCADTCSSTCASLSVSSKCPRCQEGCQCDDGYVFDGDSCIPLENCGCMVDGRYYKSGESVMQKDCTKTCSCKNGVLACKNTECTEAEICQVKKGVMDCYNTDPCAEKNCREKEDCILKDNNAVCVAQSSVYCWVMGDPHYQTFDGSLFGFQGTCSYTLVRTTGKDKTLPAFSIVNKNEMRGNPDGSFVKSISIKVKGHEIFIPYMESGTLMIDGIISNIPISLESGSIKITQSGIRGNLETDFGLVIVFDWISMFMVTITSSYYDNLAGLCGTYNANQGDDFTMPGGMVAANTTEWAQSWSVADGDPFCWHHCQGQCPTCSDEDRALYENDNYCGLIVSKEGPFHQCHDTVAPEEFASNCLYDVCLNKGRRKVYCEALASYVGACLEVGGTVSPKWREISNCPMPCPHSSHYELCSSSCPATCSTPNAPKVCSLPCSEGCQCNKGFVLSGEKCVHIERECGCMHEDRYYKPDESFWADDKCQSKCTCDRVTRTVQCKRRGCKKDEHCRVVEGVQNCYAVTYKTCTAQGDPHFRSFDGKRFDFQGNCVYKLAGVCSKDSELDSFNITLENNNRGSRRVSFAKVVTVTMPSSTFTISQNYPGKILVDGIVTSLPYYLNSSAVRIYRSGRLAVLEANFGLRVSYDWTSSVRVTVPSTYHNAMCGLCGNYNDNPNDDLLLPGGQSAMNPTEFGNIYLAGDVPGCSHVCKDCAPPTLAPGEKPPPYISDCNVITDKQGPLKDCMGKVDSAQYHENCVYDILLNQGLQKAACDIIAAYVEECQESSGKIEAWRRKDFCALPCPANSVYNITALGCPATCYSMTSPTGCNAGHREGCQCNPGFLLSDDQCVPFEDCGCHHEARYYKSGAVFYPGNSCEHRCTCSLGLVGCTEVACGPQETCTTEEGVLGCYPKSHGTCILSGDSSYLTFDRRSYDFWGPCGYTLVRVSKDTKTKGLELFCVSADMEASQETVLLEGINVNVFGLSLILERNSPWEIQVSGLRTNLPVSLVDGKLKVSQEGRGIVLQASFGLRVTYDLESTISITVPSVYMGQVSGLCGNYNGLPDDDFMLPSKVQTGDVSAFGVAWRTEGGELMCDNACPEGGCAKPGDKERGKLGHPQKCGLITDTYGPLAACHSTLPPAGFQQNCIYNSFIAGGKAESVCLGIEAYVSACQAAGVTLKAWRADLCPLACPIHSHYALCADTCHSNCMGLTNPDICSKACFEGCECDEGFVADGNTCVPIQSCGCNVEGMYLKKGEMVYLDHCSRKCTCSSHHNPMCESTRCPSATHCGIGNSILGCLPAKSTCILSKGSLVTAFEGKTFKIKGKGHFEVFRSKGWHYGMESFRVLANVHYSKKHGQSLEEILAVFGETKIIMSAGSKVWVNGNPVSLPWKPGNKKLSVTQAGGAVTVLSGKVAVTLSTDGDLTVVVPNTLLGRVKGLCGSYHTEAQRTKWTLLYATKYMKDRLHNSFRQEWFN